MKKGQYEKDFKKLDEIVEKLESQQLSLEESLELFQQGIEMYRKCHERLTDTEKMLTTIMEENGLITEKEE